MAASVVSVEAPVGSGRAVALTGTALARSCVSVSGPVTPTPVEFETSAEMEPEGETFTPTYVPPPAVVLPTMTALVICASVLSDTGSDILVVQSVVPMAQQGV